MSACNARKLNSFTNKTHHSQRNNLEKERKKSIFFFGLVEVKEREKGSIKIASSAFLRHIFRRRLKFLVILVSLFFCFYFGFALSIPTIEYSTSLTQMHKTDEDRWRFWYVSLSPFLLIELKFLGQNGKCKNFFFTSHISFCVKFSRSV